MLNYQLTLEAKSDLLDIRQYTLKQWGAEQSKKYLIQIRETIELLSSSPNLGFKQPSIKATYLSYPTGSHIIYYTLRKDTLIVVGVLHKRMLPDNHLGQR